MHSLLLCPSLLSLYLWTPAPSISPFLISLDLQTHPTSFPLPYCMAVVVKNRLSHHTATIATTTLLTKSVSFCIVLLSQMILLQYLVCYQC